MCDYSLADFRNRLAVEGEELMVYRFPTRCLGLISSADPDVKREFAGWQTHFNPREVPCAVCIPHGARLLLHDIPLRLQRQLGVGAEEHVTFIQMSADVGRYRDGLRFMNGQKISLQRLLQGQRTDVLSLSLAALSEEEPDAVEAISSAVDWWTLG